MSRLLNRIAQQVRYFAASSRGNVAIIFGLCLIPLVGLVGIGVDYGVALTDKTKLDNAADAAAVAAVATAKAYVAANPTDPNLAADAITAGKAQAVNSFAVNAGSVAFATVAAPTTGTVNLTQTGTTFAATVSYSATTQNHFGQIFGQPTITLSGTASATASVPKYLDFYLLVDVSGSMGLPSTIAGEAQLQQVNHDSYADFQQGCMFACHYPGMTGWTLATNPLNPIQLRSGAVNNAVCSLLQQASQPTVLNQYRVGIYPFIDYMSTMTGADLTNNITSLLLVAQCGSNPPMAFTNLLDPGNPNSPYGAGGTHFENIFPTMQSTIVSFGDGSLPTKPQPFVFLITDGMDNNMTYTYTNGFGAGSQPSAMDPSLCNNLKTAGATLSVLYIPYLPIVFVPNGGINSTESTKVNSISPGLATQLSQCASPGFFYQANAPSDITAALNQMFNQATAQFAHITK